MFSILQTDGPHVIQPTHGEIIHQYYTHTQTHTYTHAKTQSVDELKNKIKHTWHSHHSQQISRVYRCRLWPRVQTEPLANWNRVKGLIKWWAHCFRFYWFPPKKEISIRSLWPKQPMSCVSNLKENIIHCKIILHWRHLSFHDRNWQTQTWGKNRKRVPQSNLKRWLNYFLNCK